MQLLEHINYLISASHKAEIESRNLKEECGIDPTMGGNPLDPKVVKWAFMDRPEEAKIREYLDKLDSDVLLKLESLMYFGRGDNDFESISAYLAKLNEPKDVIILTIIEKRSAYPVYFQRAIDKLQKQGVEIDKL